MMLNAGDLFYFLDNTPHGGRPRDVSVWSHDTIIDIVNLHTNVCTVLAVEIDGISRWNIYVTFTDGERLYKILCNDQGNIYRLTNDIYHAQNILKIE